VAAAAAITAAWLLAACSATASSGSHPSPTPHISQTGDGTGQVTIPRHNPVKALTMGGIARDAGLTPEEFRKLL